MLERLQIAAELIKSLDGIARIGVAEAASAASVPLLATRLLPTLNPKIAEDLFWSTIVIALVVCAVSYIVSLPLPPEPERAKVRWPMIFGLLLFLGSWVGLLVLTAQDVSGMPFLAHVLAQMFFIGFFVGLASCIGWIAARLPNRADATTDSK
jgi:hypothetical protein